MQVRALEQAEGTRLREERLVLEDQQREERAATGLPDR
jgi:hypothetical protein